MTDKHAQWRRVGTAVYIPGGGFDVRYCPDPEELASHIVKCVNYHDRLAASLKELHLALIEEYPYYTGGAEYEEVERLFNELDTKKESE